MDPSSLQSIGFDMGGTSTDVSRFAGSYEHVFETTTAGSSAKNESGPCGVAALVQGFVAGFHCLMELSNLWLETWA